MLSDRKGVALSKDSLGTKYGFFLLDYIVNWILVITSVMR
jgi:hypothetical protein